MCGVVSSMSLRCSELGSQATVPLLWTRETESVTDVVKKLLSLFLKLFGGSG